MTVGDLKELFEDMDEDMEVRFASQPNWPFEYSITDAVEVSLDDGDANGDYEAASDEVWRLQEIPEDEREPTWQEELTAAQAAVNAAQDRMNSAPPILYLVEGQQLSYLPGKVAQEIGWS